ncbi:MULTISPECIES: methyl-accepting chemotaxis protein [Deefgea]|uniref:HAMP domain-containing protein n=1 Tax=Deefgea chitinilytica TaxID=570276 RepID=A0ABS2CBK1_9NEIS|nr:MULTISPECIES: methyl-accepting chemotaxis protein [Deefgea]MBM5571524.1 HAMP domain-containing protein [Deefgea chitinilytica]MBM9888757.1 methyl-accepting chemotaxis protein [Deefgea sp. CFH1-16]
MNNWGVKTRLLAGFGLVLSLLAVVAVVALFSLNGLRGNVAHLVEQRYPVVVKLNQLIALAYQTDIAFRNAVLAETLTDTDNLVAELKKQGPDEEAKLAEIKTMLAEDASAQALLSDVLNANVAMDAKKEKLFTQLSLDRTTGAHFINTEYALVSNAYRDALLKLAKQQGQAMDEGKSAALSSANSAFNVIALVSVFAVVLGLVMAWLIASKVIQSLYAASEVAEKIAAGDLSHDWRGVQFGDDELGKLQSSLRKMQDNLTQIIRQIRDNSEAVTRSARTLSSASQQIMMGSDEQSSSASSMAAAVEEMSTSMDQVADNTLDVEEKAKGAGQLASDGSKDVSAAAREMQAISAEVGSASEQITELGRNINEIGTIVVVIKEVADQTNLLALNAAIEAARAGDMGRGFAVVADEVRKLAERTAQSASQITNMVGNIQSSANDAVVRMSSGSRRVGDGLQLTTQASDSIGLINQRNLEVMHSVQSITEQMQEQRSAARDIAVNVERIAQMAEENSVSVRNMGDSIVQLEQMAVQLSATVQRFRVS